MTKPLTMPAAANTNDYQPSLRVRLAIATRDRHTCVYCRRAGIEPCIDHVTPASFYAPGTPAVVVNATTNLVCSCWGCNSLKGGLDLAGFARKLLSLGMPKRTVTALMKRVQKAASRPLR